MSFVPNAEDREILQYATIGQLQGDTIFEDVKLVMVRGNADEGDEAPSFWVRDDAGGTVRSADRKGWRKAYQVAAQFLSGSKSYGPVWISSGAKDSTTVTVTGAALGDFVLASFSFDLQEMSLTAAVSAANTVECTFTNNTETLTFLYSGTLSVLVIRP